MSLLFMDSFDHLDLTSGSGGGGDASEQKWTTAFSSGIAIHPSGAEGRFVAGALKIEGAGGGGWIEKSISARTELITGFSYKRDTPYTTQIHFEDDLPDPVTSPRLSLQHFSGAGSFSVSTPGGASASASSVIPDDTWVFVEFRIKLGTSDGEIEVKIDGVQKALVTGANTAGSATFMDAIRIEATNNAQEDWIDDLYLIDTLGSDNNTFIHDGVKTPRITVFRPKANGSINFFGVVGQTVNFEAVNSIIANRDIDYVEAGLIGAQEDYTMETFADKGITPGTIHGVQVVNNATNSSATPTFYFDDLVIAGTRFNSGSTKLANTTNYRCSLYIRDTDPSDDGAWTEAKVDAAGSGFTLD